MDITAGSIGFVGIGAMGTPMAGNLARAGFRLAIADASPDRITDFLSMHKAEVRNDLEALGRECGVVITMLPDGKTVRSVLTGEKDRFERCVAGGLKSGSIVIDMSSSSPLGTRQLGALLAARGVTLIDAPVSGGVRRAVDGTLAIMVGGEPATLERCRPIFERLGKQIFHAGPLGAGHAIKALNNYVSAAGLVAACEAVIAGARFGLEPDVVVDILNASTGMNNTTANKMKQFMLSGSYSAGFGLGLMAKDLRTALELSRATGAPTVLEERCTEIWNEAEQRLGAGADHTEMYRYLKELAGAIRRS